MINQAISILTFKIAHDLILIIFYCWHVVTGGKGPETIQIKRQIKRKQDPASRCLLQSNELRSRVLSIY